MEGYHPDPDPKRCKSVEWTYNSRTYTLLENPKVRYKVSTTFQIDPNRTCIDKEKPMSDQLKCGDVVVFHRDVSKLFKHIYWHFAVIVKAEETSVKVIHNNGDGVVEEVINQSILSDPKYQEMYRLDFNDDVLEKNPEWLVLARAQSVLKMGGDDSKTMGNRADKKMRFGKYDLVTNNCEMFAGYCKLGIQKSLQVSHGLRKLGEVGAEIATCAGKPVCIKLAKVLPAATLKSVGLTTVGNVAGPVTVFVVEGALCLRDMKVIFKERIKGKINWQEFNSAIAKRLTESAAGASLCIGLSFLCGFLLSFIPGFGPAAIVGAVVGGLVGAGVGRLIGNVAGKRLAEYIASKIKNDQVIHDLSELCEGDHVVITKHLAHPRHHVIFLQAQKIENKTTTTETSTITTVVAATNTSSTVDTALAAAGTDDATTTVTVTYQYRLLVIHRRNRQGVKEEWLEVEPPVYRVVWPEEERRPTQEIIERAKARVGEKGYNLLTKNCKHFAEECIKVTSRFHDSLTDEITQESETVFSDSELLYQEMESVSVL